MPLTFFSTDTKINILDQSFSENSAGHVAFVMQKLSDFTKSRDALMDLDGKLMMALGGNTLLYTIGFVGPLIASALLVAIGYVGVSKYNRMEKANEFDSRLNELMNIYHWMLKDRTADFTKENIFMDVAEAIAPFVDLSELAPWDFTKTSPKLLSERYIKLLAQPPHSLRLVLDTNSNAISHLLGSSSPTAVIPNQKPSDGVTALEAKIVKNARAALGMFEQTHAEATRAVYGYRAPRMNG